MDIKTVTFSQFYYIYIKTPKPLPSPNIRHLHLIFPKEPTPSPRCSPVADLTDVLGILFCIHLIINFNSPNAHVCRSAAAANDEPAILSSRGRRPPLRPSRTYGDRPSDQVPVMDWRGRGSGSGGKRFASLRRRKRVPATKIDVAIL